MTDTGRRTLRTVLAGLTGGVAVGPLVAFGLRSLFLIQGVAFRWVLIACTLTAAAIMGISVWVGERRDTEDG